MSAWNCVCRIISVLGPLLGLYTCSEAQLDLATVRYHALGAYAKSVYLVDVTLVDEDG